MLRAALAFFLLALALPAASPGTAPEPRMLGPYGKGADAYWLWKAHPAPKTVVVFEHGLDESELNPWNHIDWIEHLVRQGNDVIYPRYETSPAGSPALLHSLIGIHAALVRLGRPQVPLVVVGYSRGGRLAVELAAVMWRIGVKPAAVMSVYPSTLNSRLEEVVNFTHLPHSTRLLLVTADRDSSAGARELLRRLERSSFPAQHVRTEVVRSRGSFRADHFSALQSGAEARRQLWTPLDRLIASVR
jgi:pimeloyl-ACP methyl ester carboxylesterase